MVFSCGRLSFIFVTADNRYWLGQPILIVSITLIFEDQGAPTFIKQQ